MSKFDLSQVQLAATEVKEQASQQSYKYRLIYPQNGTLKVRVLFNPKSGLLMTGKSRHSIGNTKVPCMRNYGQDCPICQAIEEASSVTGADLWKLKSNTRYIFLAQYVGSDYQWDPKYPEPQIGEVVLVMVPWTVYSDLQNLIAQSGNNVTSIITENVGRVIVINKTMNNNQTKYTTNIDAFSQYTSSASQDEFDALLESLDDITDMIVPKTITEEIVNEVNEKARLIRSEYISQRVVQPVNNGQQGFNLGGVVNQVPPTTQPQPQPQTAPQFNASHASLFNGVDATMTTQPQPQPQTAPQSEEIKINPITGQELRLVNGAWVPTGNTVPTSYNGGIK